MSPDVRVEVDEIKAVLINEVIKRDVLEGDKATDARKKVTKAGNKQLKSKTDKPKAKVEEAVEELEVEPVDA